MPSSAPVGVFDSGAGGVSVLRACVAELPRERFLYLGDSANAPYGSKSPERILELSRGIVRRLVGEGAKAVVIACNTATSVAAASLRSACDLPIVGVEPALKPAVKAHPHGHVLVMATPVTLALDKYHELAAAYGRGADVVSVPCPELAARIERGNLDAPDLRQMVEGYVGRYRGWADAVVLGCTHYPFVEGTIRAVLGEVELFDGSVGTARQLRRVLAARDELCDAGTGGVTFASTKPGAEALYRQLFSL